jgi:hypothetical protein
MTGHPQQRRKPTNPQELEADIASHPDRGMLGGKLVVDLASAEYRAHVRSASYNIALQHDAALGHKKTGIAYIAVFLFITNPSLRTLDKSLLNQDYLADDGKKKREFRCYLPVQTIAEFERLRKELGLSKSEALGYALELFGHTPGLQQMYSSFVENLASANNVEPVSVRNKISGFWKRLSRDARVETGDFDSEKMIS